MITFLLITGSLVAIAAISIIASATITVIADERRDELQDDEWAFTNYD